MKKCFFSVIIPTLNEEKYLPKLLNNLVNQQYRNFETIVVDGQSQDKTVALTNRFKKNINLKIFISKKRSVAYQRNLGAGKASGSYLVFLDADSGINRSFLRKVKLYIDLTSALIITPAPHISVSKLSPIDKTINSISNNLIYISNYAGYPLYPGACLIFQRDFFIHMSGFKNNKQQDRKMLFPEDLDLMIRSKKAGVNPLCPKDISFRYSMRRFRKEGYLRVMAKYVTNAVEMILKGKSDLNIEYQMGGDYYLKDNEQRASKKLTGHFNRIKRALDRLIRNIDGN